MNMKATAILTSVVMVLAVTAIALAYESDAVDPNETVRKGDVYVAVGGTATVEFVVTEPDDGYYTNAVTWTAGADETQIFGGDTTPGTTSADITDTESNKIATVTIKADEDVGGKYQATITGVTSGDSTGFTMTYTVSTTITDADSEPVVQAIAYTMNVHVIASPLSTSMPLPSAGLQYGVYVEPYSIVSSGATGFVYYAIGLPDGMQMTPAGNISGTPVSDNESTQGSYDVTVVATHVASNQTFIETYEDVSVSAADSDAFTYSVAGAETVVDDASDDDDGRYIVRQSGTSPVTVTTQIGGINADIDHVYVVNASGSQTDAEEVEGQTGQYTIPVNGSGSYRVVMVNGDLVKSFELVVVAISYDVETGIGFSPNTPQGP